MFLPRDTKLVSLHPRAKLKNLKQSKLIRIGWRFLYNLGNNNGRKCFQVNTYFNQGTLN